MAWLEIRRPVPPGASAALGASFVIMLLLGWVLMTSGEDPFISPVVLPSPRELLSSLPDLVQRKDLVGNVEVSFVRVIKGFSLALVAVVPLGLLMGSFGGVRAFFEPLNVIAGYLPLITVIPLTFAWFLPVGEEFQKVMFLAIACFFFMLPLVIKAVEEVDEVYLNTGSTLGARKLQLITRVLLPIALPDIYNAARLAFGVGWTWIIVAETLLADKGLGFIFMTSYRFNKPHMYWTALIILAIGFGVDRILDWLGRRLFPYRYL